MSLIAEQIIYLITDIVIISLPPFLPISINLNLSLTFHFYLQFLKEK